MEFKIKLNSPDEVREFVKAASNCPADIDLKSGAVYLDAKSLLGVLTMGLQREMKVICAMDDETFMKSVQKFAIA